MRDRIKWAILDSGATSHFFVTNAPVIDIAPALQPLTVQIPDGTRVDSSHTCALDMPQLPKEGRIGHIVPGLAGYSLLSVTTLCNAGCEVHFTKIDCTVTYRGRVVLYAKKCTRTGLWMIPINPTQHAPVEHIPTTTTAIAASATVPTMSKDELAKYHHQTLCSPPKITLLKAIKNNQLRSFPGLTYQLINKYLPPSTATDKGHMVRRSQGIQSTSNNRQDILDARQAVDDMNPTEQVCAAHDIFCMAALADKISGTMYTDLPGPFPVRSFSSMVYIFIAYVYDLNVILAIPMPSRSAESMQAAFEKVITHLNERDVKVTLNVMDNESSKLVESYIKEQDIDIHMVPPNNHRVNAAERAIRTFKDHFISALATIDGDCPLQLWDQFLPQVQDTLNMLRTSRRNPTISAYEDLEGPYDYNKTPMSILGTKSLILDDPNTRTAYAPHGTDCYYVGMARKHYRCLRFYCQLTRSYRISDTYKVYPAHCSPPTISEYDRTVLAADALLRQLHSITPLSAASKVKHAKIIEQLTAIITNKQAPRVEDTGSPRVTRTSTSTNATSPRVIQNTRYVHQRRTRNNIPMPTVMEEIQPPIDTASSSNKENDENVRLSQQSNENNSEGIMTEEKSHYIPCNKKVQQSKRKVNGVLIGSKRNHHKNISRKRLQKLIEEQISKDDDFHLQLQQQSQQQQQLQQITPSDVSSPINTTIPAITQEEDDNNNDIGNIEEQDEIVKHALLPPRRESCRIRNKNSRQPVYFQNLRTAANINQAAVYHVCGLGYYNAPQYSIPTTLQHDKLTISPAIDIEEMCNGVVHPITKETITKYETLANDPELKAIWMKAMCKELGRLAQGFGDLVDGTNTIKFLSREEVRCIPADRTVTYARIVVDYRPQKDDPNRVRITVGGNLIDYPYELTTRTTDLTTTKLMWNSVISTKDAKFAVADVKNFYLNTPLDRFEYMKMKISIFPQEFIDAYNLQDKVINGYVYMEIQRGMYGLPQAGILANKLLRERLEVHGYFELPHTPGLWKHETRNISFTLAVDDFGIKYVGEENVQHLLSALRDHYEIDVDWTGALYCGITLDWHYATNMADRYVDISMPKYVIKQLVKYEHPMPKRLQHCPYSPNPIQYGKDNQNVTPEDNSPKLDKNGKKRIQQVVGSFLYYARAVDITILMALSSIAAEQANPTENTMKRINQLMDYMATHPDAVIRYKASDMILNVHSDASYLSAPKARSRAGGYFFLGSMPQDKVPIKLNGAVHVTCTILKLVAASAAEAELGALFLNAQQAKIMRITLAELGHPQPPTPFHVDNTTAVGIVNNTIKRQKSRAMEMRYFWLVDAEAQKMATFHHHPGQENLGDYPSKNHIGEIHQHVRPYYQHEPNSPTHLPRATMPSARRGCAEILGDTYLKKIPLPRITEDRALLAASSSNDVLTSQTTSNNPLMNCTLR